MSAPKLIEVAPRGDVVLICGEDGKQKTHIVTSSHILRMHSSVFNAMLEPKFKEGTALSMNSKVEVPLPDDHGWAMAMVCKALHNCAPVDQTPSPEIIKLITELGDKYDCCATMASMAYIWLTRYSDTSDATIRGQMLVTSWYFKQQGIFSRFGQDLVLESSKPVDADVADYPETLVPVLAALERQRQGFAQAIADFLAEQIEAMSRESNSEYCTRGCAGPAIKTISFIRIISKTSSWPLGNQREIPPLTTALQELREFPFDWNSDGPRCEGGGYSKDRRCGVDTQPFVEEMAFLMGGTAAKIEREVVKLCLRCVKEGNAQKKGSCNKKHG